MNGNVNVEDTQMMGMQSDGKVNERKRKEMETPRDGKAKICKRK